MLLASAGGALDQSRPIGSPHHDDVCEGLLDGGRGVNFPGRGGVDRRSVVLRQVSCLPLQSSDSMVVAYLTGANKAALRVHGQVATVGDRLRSARQSGLSDGLRVSVIRGLWRRVWSGLSASSETILVTLSPLGRVCRRCSSTIGLDPGFLPAEGYQVDHFFADETIRSRSMVIDEALLLADNLTEETQCKPRPPS